MLKGLLHSGSISKTPEHRAQKHDIKVVFYRCSTTINSLPHSVAYRRRIQVSVGRRWRRVRKVISGHVHGLYGGDGALVGGRDTLLLTRKNPRQRQQPSCWEIDVSGLQSSCWEIRGKPFEDFTLWTMFRRLLRK